MLGFKKINLIVIHPVGRAGSTFLQSLFDNHSSIIMFPSFGSIFLKINEVINDFDEELDRFIKNNLSLFDSSKGYFGAVNINVSGKFGDNADQDIDIDKEKFKKECRIILVNLKLQYSDNLNRIDFFKIVHIGYTKCFRNINFDKLKYIVYHPHTIEEFDILFNSFPNMFLFTLTRDPRQDWESIRKVISIRTGKQLSKFHDINLLNNSINYSKHAVAINKIQKKVKKNQFIVLDLIDFHKLNKNAMEFFCEKLDIDFEDSLLQSSFNGLIWGGNAANRKAISSFNINMKDNWDKNLLKEEIENLSTFNYGAIHCLEYDKSKKINEENLKMLASEIVFKNLKLKYTISNVNSNFFAIFSTYNSKKNFKKFIKEFLKRIFIFLKSVVLVFNVQNHSLRRKLSELEDQQKFLYNNSLPGDVFLKEIK